MSRVYIGLNYTHSSFVADFPAVRRRAGPGLYLSGCFWGVSGLLVQGAGAVEAQGFLGGGGGRPLELL